MTEAALLAVSVSFTVINNLLIHAFKNRGLRGMGDILLFNSLLSGVWTLILFILNAGDPISAQALLWGIVYGAVTSAFLLCKMQALSSGPVSITAFIGSSSLLISTLFGVLYFKETATFVQTVGVVLLLLALFLMITSQKRPENEQKASRAWYIWCSLFFLCSGATGIIFKLHQSSPSRGEVDQMMLSAAVTSALLFLIASVAVQLKTDKTLPRIKSPALVYVILCGTVSCGYNRLNVTLSGKLPSIVFFPIFNGSVILISSLLSALIFRERITRRQIFALITGTLALIMTAGVIAI